MTADHADKRTSLESALEVVFAHADTESAAATILDQILSKVVAPFHRSVSWGDRLLTLDKSAAFKRDASFQKAVQIATGSTTGTTQYASPDGILWRINTVVWAARHALQIPGDFVECGVYFGDMAFAISETVDLEAAKKCFYLYDTFAGFSEKYSSPDDFPDGPKLYDYLNSAYTINGLHDRVCRRFALKPSIMVIKGVVPDVLVETSPDRISFLHLDMNAPRPERLALERLFDRVSPGGIVILDDYGWILHRRQKDAADRFMADQGYHILEMPTGQRLVIKR